MFHVIFDHILQIFASFCNLKLYFYYNIFHLGVFIREGASRFEKWPISSFVRVQINRELVIDNPDRFEQPFDQYYILEDPKKNFHARYFDGVVKKCSFLTF